MATHMVCDDASPGSDSALPMSLHEKSLSELFRSYILDGKSLSELGFDEEQHKLNYHWPVTGSFEGSSFPIIKAHNSGGGYGTFADGGPNPPLIRKRFQALLDWLNNGQLVACWRNRDNEQKEVPRYLFSRVEIYIDFFRGDLVERRRRYPARTLYEAIVLVRPQMTPAAGILLAHRHMPNRLTSSQQAVHEAVTDLWPEGIPAGLRAKVRNDIINQWFSDNDLSRVSDKTIQRYFAKRRSN